jgi:PmbA protein
MECLLIAEDKNGMQSDGDFTMARTNTDLLSIEELAKKAIKNVVKKLSPQKLTTQKCAILFDPTCAKSLLGALLSAISGENLYQQSSFLLNCLDTKIFPDFINIDERPHLLGEIGSTPFDSEGVATQAKYFVKDGILTNYLLNSYTARKLGMQTTGNAGGISNLFINSTSQNFAELLKLMGTGLFVTDVFGQGVNIITGDYSRGAFGFWVENGEIKYPVHEITIAGNIKNMFQNIIAVGKDVDNRGSIKTGSILIADMSVAGN